MQQVRGPECSRTYRKLKQLVAFLVGLVLLDGLGQDVDGFCVADALETRLRDMLQPVLYLRVRVAINLCRSKVVQVLPTPYGHHFMQQDMSLYAHTPHKNMLLDACLGSDNLPGYEQVDMPHYKAKQETDKIFCCSSYNKPLVLAAVPAVIPPAASNAALYI